MKRHALFVGVNNYADSDIPPLKFAVNDATDLAGFFKHRANFDCAEVLPDPRNYEVVLDRVHDMLDGLGAGDDFLFFFAGHGVTTLDGHRLVCAGDRLARVRHSWAGLPLELLKGETVGAFNRLFVLDACRTDVLATNRGVVGSMGNGTRDLIMEGACQAGSKTGSLTILCSCNDGECAGECAQLRHGLFSKALLDLLDEEERNGRQVLVNEDFAYRQLPVRMCALAKNSGMESKQNPQKEGPPILILEGADPIDGRKTRQAKNNDLPKRSTKKSAESRQNRQEVVHNAEEMTCQALPAVAACCFYEAGQYRLLVKKWPEGVSEICITAPGMSPMYRKQEVFNTNRIYLPSTVDARKTEIVVQAILRSGDEVCAYVPRTKVSFKGTKRTLFVSLERVGGMFKKGAWGITVDVDDESPLPKLTVVVKKSDGSKTEHLVHEGKLKPGETFHFPPSWGVARGTVISVMKPDEFTFIKYRTMKKIQ